MRALYDELGAEDFAREGLCVWDPEPGSGGGVIPVDSWSACGAADHKPDGRLSYALDVSPDGRSCAVATSDGTHLEIVKHADGTAWVVPVCVEKRDAFTEIVLDAAGPAAALIAPLEAAGITVRKVTTEEAKAACAAFLTAVTDRTMVHIGQSMLDAAVANADRRDVGDGGWLWSRLRSTVDISPLYAVTLARWAAGVTVPVPTPGFVDLDDLLE